MTKAEALSRLRAREPQLRALGIERLAIFGSTARGDARPDSDVDLAAEMNYETVRTLGPFGFFGIEDKIADLIGVKVDLVTEPSDAPRLQAQIDRGPRQCFLNVRRFAFRISSKMPIGLPTTSPG